LRTFAANITRRDAKEQTNVNHRPAGITTSMMMLLTAS
jgi:hypothetical protein